MPTIAQKLRKNPTPAEVRFWRLIESLRTGAYHFRKQVALGPYVVDFACHAAMVVIEIDGETHFTREGVEADGKRDSYLRGRGYRVLRFSNVEVMQNGDGVYRVVADALASQVSREPPPWPSPQGGG